MKKYDIVLIFAQTSVVGTSHVGYYPTKHFSVQIQPSFKAVNRYVVRILAAVTGNKSVRIFPYI